jgi:acetoin utilization protein AcuB
MLVREWMASDVLTIDENTSMMKALHLMKENNIRRLPVTARGSLVGIISDRDLKEASPSKATTLDVHELYYLLAEIKVKEIMTKNPLIIQQDETVERAAVIMLEHKVSGLPVLNKDRDLVGIITQSDVFRAFVNITGIYKGGVQFAFSLEDKPGSIKEVADTIREFGGRIVSILSSTDMVAEGTRNVYIRVRGMEPEALKNMEATLRRKSKVIYVTEDVLKTI